MPSSNFSEVQRSQRCVSQQNESLQITRQAKLYRYSLPMDSGVIVRQQRLLQREGYIIALSESTQEQQVHGLGECAPLPAFSQETLAQVEAQLLPILAHWQQTGEWPKFEALYPSVAFGLSAAMYELKQQLPQAGEYRAAPLCSGDPDELIAAFEPSLDQEANPLDLTLVSMPRVAKLKVGLYEPIRDGMLVELLLESIPDLTLRLDANCSWRLEQALQFAQYVSSSLRNRIAFIEEPCQTPQQSRTFAEKTQIAIAWDETLQHAVKATPFNFAELHDANLSALVIKPTLVGSLDRCIELIREAKDQGLEVVISSSLESTIGLSQLARFSAWQTPNQTPGLDTLQLFKSQLERTWPDSELPIVQLADQAQIYHWY